MTTSSPALEPFDYGGKSKKNGSSNLPKAVAIQALAEGRATEHQQQVALKCIVEDICGYYDISFQSDERMTSFAEGKRFVGAQVVKLTRINYNEIRSN